ncbi:hypothetical protein HO173_001240 [Letharia columbiana]|uniref:Chromo domain-containing protein n=1 Tax=Letharia columbiana TaxID=112416 RepID=A0A8H6G542_9LECA|nr:uncharacterized protein HO173_001240 [Letharia columbiana]KAF6240570.1 hypothetical protein HO173_001240 [Letharia columbiana]
MLLSQLGSILSTRRGKGHSVEYLARWKGYGPEYDQWYNVKQLGDAPELVKDYEIAMSPLSEPLVATLPELLPPLPTTHLQKPSAIDHATTLSLPPLPELPPLLSTTLQKPSVIEPSKPTTEKAIAVVIPRRKELTM